MSRKDWSSAPARAAFDDGHEEGVHDAAQELMDALRDVGVRDDNWADIDLVEIVTQWLDNHGIDMHVDEGSVR